MPPSEDVAGPHFTDAELDRVEDDLIRVLEDVRWPSESQYFRPSFLNARLRERGHTRARIEATLRRLLERGVWEWRDHQTEGLIEIEFQKYFTTRARWFGYVAQRRGPRAAGEAAHVTDRQGAIDTWPDAPRPPEPLVEAARRDVPRTLADLDHTTASGAGDPAPGQRIVLHGRLVRELAEKRQHGQAAAAWAVHRLVQQGMLTARWGRGATPGVVDLGGGWAVQPVEHVLRDRKYLLIESTPRLWDWWAVLEQDQAVQVALPTTPSPAEPADDPPALADPPPDRAEADAPFIPTDLQERILETLRGKSLTLDALETIRKRS